MGACVPLLTYRFLLIAAEGGKRWMYQNSLAVWKWVEIRPFLSDRVAQIQLLRCRPSSRIAIAVDSPGI